MQGKQGDDSKLKTWAKHAVTRADILKNQHYVRCSHAWSDVIQLLNHGHHEQALLRVGHVIQEQNMAEVFSMVEKYCHVLAEKATQSSNTDSPKELEEAISGLIFISSRARNFPELVHIRDTFTAKSGKQYAADSIESPSCNVNLQIIQKFSERQLSYENRLMFLKEIAAENGISLHLGEGHTVGRKFIARAEHDKGDSSAQSSHSHATHGNLGPWVDKLA